MYIYIYIYIYIPAPGLPRMCFGMYLIVFMMTYMFISWYLQDFWSNHHHVWSEHVGHYIVFYFFIIFHLYLHAFVNARSRHRLFQDALFFDGFAFRHRDRTNTSDFTFFFFCGAALTLHVRSNSLGCHTAHIGTGIVFPAPLPLVCVQVHDTRSVA